jgi:hypothetical protein
MTEPNGDLGIAWWAKNLDDVDSEVARLAIICHVRILDPGIIERVLQNDSLVCGTRNPIAFEKLRSVLMMHYHVRDSTVSAIGSAQTSRLVAEVVERLRKRIGDQLGGSRPSDFRVRLRTRRQTGRGIRCVR